MITVRHLLDRKAQAVYTIDAENPVLEAIQMMADHHIGALIVLRNGEVAGILSERDYARKVILMGRSSAETPAWQIMSSPVHTVAQTATLDACMRVMTEKRIRHLPVMEDRSLIGMISIGDLVKAVIEEQQRTIEQLESYIHR